MSTILATQLMYLRTCIALEGVLRQPLATSTKHVIKVEKEKLLHVEETDSSTFS